MGGRDGSLTERVLTRPRSTRATLGLLVLAAGLLFGSHVRAEEEAAKSEESTEELTKKTQNPVADLISVPLVAVGIALLVVAMSGLVVTMLTRVPNRRPYGGDSERRA